VEGHLEDLQHLLIVFKNLSVSVVEGRKSRIATNGFINFFFGSITFTLQVFSVRKEANLSLSL
jgi:hypothetical protein